MRPPHIRALVPLVAAVAVGLSGCGDGGAPPQTLPPLTSSATPRATPPATPTPTSSAAELQRSAEQFVRTYYRAYDRAFHSADPSVLQRDFYNATCSVCARNVNILDEFRQKKQHFEDYEFVIQDLDVAELRGNTAAATVVLHHAAGRIIRDSDNSVVQSLPATTPVQTDLILARLGREWRIAEIVSRGRAQS